MELIEELMTHLHIIVEGTNLREVKRSYFRACNILTKLYDTTTEIITLKGENHDKED